MGTMTQTELREDLQQLHLRNRSDVAGVTTDRLNRWLDWGYLHVSHPTVHRHYQLSTVYDITLVANDGIYSLNAATVSFQFNALSSVFYVDATAFTDLVRKRTLKPRPIDWFDNKQISVGEPSIFAIGEAENIYMSPAPSTTEAGNLVRVRGWREPTLFSVGTDVTVLPPIWDEALLQAAKWRALRDLDYKEDAAFAKQDMVDVINEIADRRLFEAEMPGWSPGIVSDPIMPLRG